MFKSIEAAVKELGAEQALKDLNRGAQQRQYRKQRNIEREAMLEALKASPEALKQVRAKLAQAKSA